MHELRVSGLDPATGTFALHVRCGGGTYVRTLIVDLARAVGSAAHEPLPLALALALALTFAYTSQLGPRHSYPLALRQRVQASPLLPSSPFGEAGRPRCHVFVAERGGHEPQLGEVRLARLLDEVAHLS